MLLFSATIITKLPQTMWKELSNLTGDEAGVHVCVCTVNILVSCEVSGGVVVQTYSKPIKTAKNVLRWLLELALMVNNI